MDEERVRALETAVDLLIQAKERLAPHAPSKTRLFLDLLLLDLAEQLAPLIGHGRH